MEKKSTKKELISIMVFCISLCLSVSLSQAEVKPGDVIDSGNWQKAVDVLPPLVVEMLKTHGLVIHVSESKEYPLPPKFAEATKKYAGTAKLENSLLDYKAGLPFPDIDPKDSNAGLKIAWNNQYRCYPEENYMKFEFQWVNKNGYIERKASGWWKKMLFVGRVVYEPSPEILPNPEGVISKEVLQLQNPQDVAGVGFLSIRYKSEKKDDDSWAYVPALRRVRRMSSAQRTDAYLGTDLAIEDYQGFSGKITEFDWKLIGKKKILCVRNTERQPVLYGGNRYKWCAVDVPWELRDAWILEVRSKAKGHPYSKRTLYLDAQWYDTLYSEAFDRKGDPWKIWISYWYFQPKWRWFTLGGPSVIDFQSLHGTIVPVTTDLNQRLSPEMFTIDRLEKLGY